MVTIALLRGLDRKRFDGRHDYYAHGPAASFANSAGELVCGVLQKSVEPSELVLALAGTSRWKHFPWLTPVLGSGCVQMTERSRAKLLVLAYQLEYQVHDIIKSDKTAGEGRVEVDGVEPRQLARMAKRFTDALIRDRLQHNRSSSAGSAMESKADEGATTGDEKKEGSAPDPPVSELSARLLLLGSLLTNFYFGAKALSSRPLDRLSDDLDENDEATLSVSEAGSHSFGVSAQDIDLLAQRCIWQCSRALSTLAQDANFPKELTASDQTTKDNIRNAVASLLREIARGLNATDEESLQLNRRLGRLNLRILTEVSWYLITNEIGDYYSGWSDILFGLLLSRPVVTPVRSTRPHFPRLKGHQEALSSLMSTATEQSWAQRRDSEPTSTIFDRQPRCSGHNKRSSRKW